MKFIIAKEVFEQVEGACFGMVAARNIDNTKAVPEITGMLEQAVRDGEAYYSGRKVKEAPEILPYREAFQKLGINPNKFMCSIEALLTRVSKGKGLPGINAAVDLGNAISVKHKVPLGAHDADSLANGILEVRLTAPEDTFLPFGETEMEKPDAGEIVYVSNHTVRTRRWIWRQSEAGKITEKTSAIMFPLDGFLHANKDTVIQARDELAALLPKFFGCEVCTGFIDAENREFEAVFT